MSEHEVGTVEEAEQWLPVVGWEDCYEVSTHGRVRNSRVGGHNGRLGGRVLKAFAASKGYRAVRLSRDDCGKTLSVHRIVALAHLGPAPSARHQVAHLNGIRHDNRAANLQWKTRVENMADCVLHGTRVQGERHKNSKLTERQVIEMREIAAAGAALTDLSSRYGVTLAAISGILNGTAWKHAGGPLRAPGFDGRAVLSSDSVAGIRARYAAGARQVDLARDYGVGQSTISRVVRGAA